VSWTDFRRCYRVAEVSENPQSTRDPPIVFLHHHHPQSSIRHKVRIVELGDVAGEFFEGSSHTTIIALKPQTATGSHPDFPS